MAGMIFAFLVAKDIFSVEQYLLELAGSIHGCLVSEVGRGGVTAFPARKQGFCTDVLSKFNCADKTVAKEAIPFFHSRYMLAAKGGQATPGGGGHGNRQTGLFIVKSLVDVCRNTLVAV